MVDLLFGPATAAVIAYVADVILIVDVLLVVTRMFTFIKKACPLYTVIRPF